MSGIVLAEYDPVAPRQQFCALLKIDGAMLDQLRVGLARGCPGVVISHDPGQGLMLAAFPEDGDRLEWLRVLAAALDAYVGAPAGTAPELLETRLVAVDCDSEPALPFSRFFTLLQVPPRPGREEPCLVMSHGTSFGSGRHPSTRLAMAALDRLAERAGMFPARVLDVGCGSGILSLACGILGAREVLGIDIDAGALVVAAANAASNRLSDRVRFSGERLAELTGRYDLLVANVTGAVMCGMVTDFARLASPRGWLVVSGLQGRQFEEMVELLAGLGFAVVARFADLPWRAGLLRFRGAGSV